MFIPKIKQFLWVFLAQVRFLSDRVNKKEQHIKCYYFVTFIVIWNVIGWYKLNNLWFDHSNNIDLLLQKIQVVYCLISQLSRWNANLQWEIILVSSVFYRPAFDFLNFIFPLLRSSLDISRNKL